MEKTLGVQPRSRPAGRALRPAFSGVVQALHRRRRPQAQPPGPATSLADDGWRVGCSFFMVVFLFFHFAPPRKNAAGFHQNPKKKKKVISTEMLPCPSLKMSFREFRELSKTTTSPVLNQCFIEAPSVVTLPCRGGSVCKGVPGIGLNVCSAQCKVHVVIS